jgi:predicted MFS family arabinose efflux permease
LENFKNDKMFQFIAILTVCTTAGFQTWSILFDNFVVNTVGLEGYHMGILQSVREIPGFMALLVIFLLLILKEHKLSVLSVMVLGIGLLATGLLPSFGGLLLTTIVSSLGFHYYETTRQSLTLQYFDEETAPIVIGKQISYSAATSVVVSILIYIMAIWLSNIHIFIIFGVAIVGVCLFMLTKNPTRKNIVPQQKKIIFKKKYWLFYTLTFMAGARRQIFIAFAVFLLVQKFGFSVRDISLLFLLNSTINYFISPYVGKAIVRFGERKILSIEYLFLILVFISYAFVESKVVVVFLYVADHVIFNFSIGIGTYFQKIAEPEDIAPSAAVGFTINHIAAVALPVLGGYLWMIDYRIPFLGGAVMGFVSLCLVQLIKLKPKKRQGANILMS